MGSDNSNTQPSLFASELKDVHTDTHQCKLGSAA
jgi:hypothetical protein